MPSEDVRGEVSIVTVFLGAGFSHLGGVPLAPHLFDKRPEVDSVGRDLLVNRVVALWEAWHTETGGAAEQYLSYLQKCNLRDYYDAVKFVGLSIALQMGELQFVLGRGSTITRHSLTRTSGVPVHESFWTTLFRTDTDVAVVTTNYDILPERGIRHEPRPRVIRPGFNYGHGTQPLAGRGYPSYAHIRDIKASGSVPIFKLHGSISWSIEKRKLIHYHDCRPAVRGDPAIVAPVMEKYIPWYLAETWEMARDAMRQSSLWIVVGYSMPSYDSAVRDLLVNGADHGPAIHIFDPDPHVGAKFSELIKHCQVHCHPGLPEGLRDLGALCQHLSRA